MLTDRQPYLPPGAQVHAQDATCTCGALYLAGSPPSIQKLITPLIKVARCTHQRNP
jgi:hypothetical protein